MEALAQMVFILVHSQTASTWQGLMLAQCSCFHNLLLICPVTVVSGIPVEKGPLVRVHVAVHLLQYTTNCLGGTLHLHCVSVSVHRYQPSHNVQPGSWTPVLRRDDHHHGLMLQSMK
jgi:hypothetical protein